MLKRFTIFGERCSGTNFLEESILCNFDAELTWDFGYKHFFGHKKDCELENSHDCLFLCIVRDGYSWMNSLRKNPHHLHQIMNKDNSTFLSSQVNSINEDGNIKEEDMNWKTKEFFKNLYELRKEKTEYLLDVLPQKVRHCIFFRYEDLCTKFQFEMNRVVEYLSRQPTRSILFFHPRWYKKEREDKYVPDKRIFIRKDEYYHDQGFQIIRDQEKRLGYIHTF
jgi:hypothetical protein